METLVVTEERSTLQVAENVERIEVAEARTVLSVSEESGSPVVVSEQITEIVVLENVLGATVNVTTEQIVVSETVVGTQGAKGDRGVTWRGVYSSGAEYAIDDVVREGSSLYICRVACQGIAVTNPDYWQLFMQGAGDATFHFQQSTPSDTWIIDHNLGKFPSVAVVDSAGSTVRGKPEYVDANRVIVYFSSPFGGDAYLN